MIRACKKCGEKFDFKVKSQRFCNNCKTLTCEVCGKQYFAKRATKIFAEHKYCSKECSIIGAVNTRWSDYEYKIKEKHYTAFDKPDFYYDGHPVCIGNNGSPCIKANSKFYALHIYVWEKYHRTNA